MKARITVLAILLALTVVGIGFYSVLKRSGHFQDLSADAMKAVALNAGAIRVEDSAGLAWVFPSQPELWKFRVKGSLLEVVPPKPQVEGNASPGALIGNPELDAVLKSLASELRSRLRIEPNSKADLHVLAPSP